MNRREFIESRGASCKNWRWSWSFVNESERFVIFGAWEHLTDAKRTLILSDDWKRASSGKRSPGFFESREHLKLVAQHGYRLFTFPMVREEDGTQGPSKLRSFEAVLTPRELGHEQGDWFAYGDRPDVPLTEEVQEAERYIEGASRTVLVNAYERSRQARAACIAKFGAVCAVCGFDFESRYGPEMRGFIHVHHLVPLAALREQYELDPAKHLRPVCPNCHAVIHHGNQLLSIEDVKRRMRRARGA